MLATARQAHRTCASYQTQCQHVQLAFGKHAVAAQLLTLAGIEQGVPAKHNVLQVSLQHLLAHELVLKAYC